MSAWLDPIVGVCAFVAVIVVSALLAYDWREIREWL